MEESKKCDFELLHDQYQQIKILQKLDIPVDNNVTEPSTEMKIMIDLMIEKIDNLIVVHDSLYLRLLAMKTTLFYEQSKLLISLGEEALAQNILLTALDNVNDVISKSEIIFLAFRIINHYAYLLTKQSEFDKPRDLLEFAESTYRKLKNENSKISFYTSDDLFSPNKNLPPPTDTSNKLERLVTNNLQMLGFIYNKQELYDKFAEYHHEVLKRQLETHDGDVTMWATKSAKLASYFLSKNRFKEARHHLAAAIYVLYNHEKELKAVESSDNTIKKWDELQQRFADVAKNWVKYGLFLFSVSKTNIVSHFCGEPSQLLERLWTLPFKDDIKKTSAPGIISKNANITDKESDLCQEGIGDRTYESPAITVFGVNPVSESIPKSTENVQQPESNRPEKLNAEEYQGPFLVFESLKLIEYEEQVTASYIETTAQARDLFIYTHSWLKRAKTFYTLRDHPMEYINAILDLSELYRYLAFYEEDIESQYAVQKLRADALETLSAVLKEVRPQCYMAVSVELLRELAEVQLEMMGLNLRRIYSAQESLPETSDMTLHQMDALADIHSRLEQFGDHIGHNVDSGDTGLMPVSEMAGDVGQYVNQ
ncbi:KIF1-binding protein homolog [Cephus cinctus]|uniref:KIF-binding protein n=1 Tax=Cephus cinctus TaxID=211228 RepID=A0AAJ7RVH6_CEPCN|nr:KIF1-binding protein homolog [Cephus cinctus]